MGEYADYEGQLEIRRGGGARSIAGSLPLQRQRHYQRPWESAQRAVCKSGPLAMQSKSRTARIDILVGHDFGKPVASRQNGTLTIADSAEAVTFEAALPEEALMPSWVADVILAIEAGLMVGLSPGFRIPPPSVVPNAERLIPEPGNPGVQIREISDAVLREFSIVTNGVYDQSLVELRAEDQDATTFDPRSVYQWL